MKTRFQIAFIVSLLAVGLIVQIPGDAATPGVGTLNSSTSTQTWSGSFVASVPTATPVGCAGTVDPSCDHYFLTVDMPHNTLINVAVSTPPSTVGDDIQANDVDLFVYAPDGITVIASSAGATGQETLTFNHNAIVYGTGPYEVRVQPWLVEPMTPYDGIARVGNEIDVEGEDCLQLPPVVAPPLAPPDTADPIKLSVVVLLDGVSLSEGQTVMNRAAKSYEPLGINLVVSKYLGVSFAGTEGQAKIDQAKAFFGGSRPRRSRLWSDIVYVLTNTDITTGGNTGLAGLADCIGGVRFDNRAFAVGESIGQLGGPFSVGPARLFADLAAEVAAHEIGHLMSAHHHYANCIEGLPPFPSGEMPTELDPCTLMFNVVDFTSLNFSTVNQFTVRGVAETFARP